MQAVSDALRKERLSFSENVPMSERTTLRVGGPADFLVEAQSAGEIHAAFGIAKAFGMDAMIVGNGSNLLVRDGGIRGIVVRLGNRLSAITQEGKLLRAGAGAALTTAALAAQRAGLSGMETLAGIPGTIGGAVYMNAGAYGGEVSAVLQEATLLKPDGTVETVPASELELGYRHSRMMKTGEIVLEALFRLDHGEPDAIMAAIKSYAAKRREKQPLSMPSAGSFFKRPQGHFAGALIEQAGLKGTSVGGAQVSAMHAGFLVNQGSATARDFLNLSALVSERVLAQSGVMLEPEVQIVGCDSSC